MADKPNLQIVNLTGHGITILDVFENRVMVIQGNGAKAWVDHRFVTRRDQWLGHIPLKDLTTTVRVHDTDDRDWPFPDPEPGVIYVVSAACAAILQAQGRSDVYSPGPLVRDKTQPKPWPIKGCVGLAQHLQGA